MVVVRCVRGTGGVWCGGRDRGKEALNGCSWVESVRIYRDEFIEPQVKEVREGGGGGLMVLSGS